MPSLEPDLPAGRILQVVAAIVCFALWGWSLVPVVVSWNVPGSDGFQAIPFVLATFSVLPASIGFLLAGNAATGPGSRRRIALTLAAFAFAVLALIVVMSLTMRG